MFIVFIVMRNSLCNRSVTRNMCFSRAVRARAVVPIAWFSVPRNGKYGPVLSLSFKGQEDTQDIQDIQACSCSCVRRGQNEKDTNKNRRLQDLYSSKFQIH